MAVEGRLAERIGLLDVKSRRNSEIQSSPTLYFFAWWNLQLEWGDFCVRRGVRLMSMHSKK